MAIIKQYVNLDPEKPAQLDGLDRARAGKRVVFEATVDPAEAGVSVQFDVIRGATNITEAGEASKFVATTDAEGKARLPFELTAHGGDEFTVKASLSLGQNAGQQLGGTDTYVVWRRIYYQLSRFGAGVRAMNQPQLHEAGPFDLDPVKAEFEAAQNNIELVDKSTVDLIARHANVLTEEADLRDYKASAADHYDATRERVSMRIVIVNQIADPKTAKITLPRLEKDAYTTVTVPHRLWVDGTLATSVDWLVSAEWSWSYGVGWHPLDRACFSKIDKTIMLDLSNAKIPSRGKSAFKETVEVRFTYRYLASSTNGLCWHNAIWIASSSMASGSARAAGDMHHTVIHEIGHFLYMVVKGQPTYYEGHGHVGPHCAAGLSPADRAKSMYDDVSGTCVMFGASGTGDPHHFCPACAISLRKCSATRGGMPADWLPRPLAGGARSV